MSFPLFAFTGKNNPDQTQAAGLQQYMLQGQLGVNPGQPQIAASDPISAAGKNNLADALSAALASGPPAMQDPAENAMAQGAINNPNINGQNMGGVGPTRQNFEAMQNPNFAFQVPTQQQKLAAFLNGGG